MRLSEQKQNLSAELGTATPQSAVELALGSFA